MKKILLLLITIVMFSCASAPEQPPVEQPEPEAVQKPVSITDVRNRAYSAMEKALSIKANIAVKDEYSEAKKMFDNAEALDASDPEAAAKAALIYLDAETAFNTVYDTAFTKRENASKELQMAKDDIKAVEEDADKADAESAETPEGGAE